MSTTRETIQDPAEQGSKATPSSSGPTPSLAEVSKVRIPHLRAAKERGEKVTMLTAYDALTAQILDAAGSDMLLVGDSIGNVMFGYDTTMPVEMDEMVVATRSVARVTKRAFVVADMPFGSYEGGPEQALANAVRLIKVGANAVKLEGGASRAETVRALVEAGIPVVAHLGFTPQSLNMLGGFRVQGRGEQAASALISDAEALAQAGAFAVVLEMVPSPLATEVTQRVDAVTIGIGAGAETDGQVLVWSDMAGMTDWTPRFARRFGEVGQALSDATANYLQAVRSGSFPADSESFQG